VCTSPPSMRRLLAPPGTWGFFLSGRALQHSIASASGRAHDLAAGSGACWPAPGPTAPHARGVYVPARNPQMMQARCFVAKLQATLRRTCAEGKRDAQLRRLSSSIPLDRRLGPFSRHGFVGSSIAGPSSRGNARASS